MEPVGIPAGSDSRVSAHLAVGVQLEREAQELESDLIEEQVTVTMQLAREHGRARAVAGS